MSRRVHERNILEQLKLPHNDQKWQYLDEIGTYEYRDDRDGIFSLQYSHDGSILAVGFGDGAIELISIRDCRVHNEVRRGRYSSFPLLAMRFHPTLNNIMYSVSLNGRVFTINMQTGATNLVNEVGGHDMTCIDFSVAGDLYATGGKGCMIKLFDASNNQEVHTFRLNKDARIPGETVPIGEIAPVNDKEKTFSLKFHPDHNHVFLTGGWDKNVKIWDTRTNEGIQRIIYGPFICGDSLDVKANDVLTGSWMVKEGLKIFDFRSGELIKTLPFSRSDERGDFIYCAQFAGSHRVLAAGSGTNSMKLIDTEKKQIVSEFKLGKPVQTIDYSTTTTEFAVGGMGTVLKFGQMLQNMGEVRDKKSRFQLVSRVASSRRFGTTDLRKERSNTSGSSND